MCLFYRRNLHRSYYEEEIKGLGCLNDKRVVCTRVELCCCELVGTRDGWVGERETVIMLIRGQGERADRSMNEWNER